MRELEERIRQLEERVDIYQKAASDTDVLRHEIEAQRAELEQLHTDYQELKQTERFYRKHGVPGDEVVLEQHAGMTAKAAEGAKVEPLHFGVSVTLRYLYGHFGDTQDLRITRDQVFWATRLRLYATYEDPESIVTGGLRFSAAQNPNPASSFIQIGDGFRGASFPLDRYYMNVTPFDDRQLLRVTLGKMPLPIWRGDRGGFRGEMVWDNDISPAGLSGYLRFFENDSLKIDNSLSYFVVHDFFDNRFQGLTGETSMIVDQLRLVTHYVTGAFAFYSYENINAGLRAPGFGEGTLELTTPTNAWLLNGDFQRTNNQIEYGPGAVGFTTDAFRTLNGALEGHVPIDSIKALGHSEIFAHGEMAYNLSVDEDAFGIGGSVGVLMGDFEEASINPLQLWFTYRYVEADATLAAFADSDLGSGTNYKGFEVAGQYDIFRNLTLVCSYFNYTGFPNQLLQQHRFFADAIWTY